MNHYYMVTVQIAYKKKGEEVGIEDIFPLTFPSDTPLIFNAVTLAAFEQQAVKYYYDKNKIDKETLDKASSQLIAVSYLGQMESFTPTPKKKEEVN